MPEINDLLAELETERKEIKTDSYSMSIGELINLYKDGELELAPAYQRLFRWSNEQKSRFIESIMLGIPIPPIFVAQKEDGKWSIVDGVQRLSTILQFTGDLNTGLAPLTLDSGNKLPALEGFTWETLTMDIKRNFKRSKFAVNIILTHDSIQAQYELFQRLNTGGLSLEPQEIRNCLIIMLDHDFYDKINLLKEYPSFLNAIHLSNNKIKEEYHMELILRYFIAKHNSVQYDNYPMFRTNLNIFFDQETASLIADPEFDIDAEINSFKEVMDFINDRLGENAFKRYHAGKETFEGGFSNACFELVTTGIATNFDTARTLTKDQLEAKIIAIYAGENFTTNTRHGIKAIQRFRAINQLSREEFSV